PPKKLGRKRPEAGRGVGASPCWVTDVASPLRWLFLAAQARRTALAEAAHVRGPAVTPFLLAAMAEETSGESITTNVALLRNNAATAALVAQQLASL
ncbi:pseudouridine-5'-phosphate glycosidase, partial [Candidatus Gracilibacteria bacterium]|nr:pseudouridine-5'-phosphate glycosidase [Candidatus Gracilibacteria bacterium]